MKAQIEENAKRILKYKSVDVFSSNPHFTEGAGMLCEKFS